VSRAVGFQQTVTGVLLACAYRSISRGVLIATDGSIRNGKGVCGEGRPAVEVNSKDSYTTAALRACCGIFGIAAISRCVYSC